MAEDIRDRVQKLMALALNNPSEQEARSAAMKAVRLIHEHELLTPTPVVATPPPSYWPTPQTPYDPADLSSELFRAQVEWWTRSQTK